MIFNVDLQISPSQFIDSNPINLRWVIVWRNNRMRPQLYSYTIMSGVKLNAAYHDLDASSHNDTNSRIKNLASHVSAGSVLQAIPDLTCTQYTS